MWIITLTTAADVKSFLAGNDTIDGGTVIDSLTANDVIVDASTTDSDTLNATITVAAAALNPTISNIESINVTAKYGSAGMSLANVTGATTVTALSGVTGGEVTLTNVKASTTTAVKAGNNVSGLNVSANETDGTAGTVNIDLGSAAASTLTGVLGKTDAFALTVNGNVTSLDEATLADSGDKVTITATADATITAKTGGAFATTQVLAGAKSITLKSTSDQLNGKTVTDSTTAGTTTAVITDTASGHDLTKVGADVIELQKVTTTADSLKFANNSTVKLTLTTATGADNVLDLQSNSTEDTINIQLNGNAKLSDHATKYFKTVNMTSLADATVNADLDNTNVTLNVSGAKNVTLTTGSKAKAVNAATLTGSLSVEANGNLALVTGGSASDTITLTDPGNVKLILDGGSGSADTIKLGAAVDLTNGANDKTSVFANIDKIDLNGYTLTTNQKALLANGNTWQLVNTAAGGSKAYTVALDAGQGSLVVDLTNVTTTNATFAVTGSAGNDTVIGADSADAITAGGGLDNLSGGAGGDTFIMQTNMGVDTVLQTIAGGAGSDKITLSGTVKDVAFTNVTSVETVDLAGAATLTLAAKAQAAGVVTVTDSTNSGGSIDASGMTTGLTVTMGSTATIVKGGSGNDTITVLSTTTASNTIQAGSGNDTITVADGATASQVIKFEANATANGVDTIAGFEAGSSAADGDVLNFTAFFSGAATILAADGTLNAATAAVGNDAFDTSSSGEAQLAGKVAFFSGGATALTTTQLAAQFGTGKAFTSAFTNGGKAVLIEGYIADGTTRGANVYYVQDADSNGAVSASEIVLVGTTNNVDLDALYGNQVA